MIIVEKCLAIGLPEPHKTEDQVHYVTRVIAEGYAVNARICDQIGIYNLHSIAQQLWELGIDFEWVYSRVYCPLLNAMTIELVPVIYMTMDQQITYWKGKRKPIKEATQ